MRIATWNVNSIRTRVGRVVDWLVREDIDVLAMQEIKCRPDQFPVEAFEQAGYHLEIHGLNQWNGVAFASRHEMTDVARGFADMPGFGKPIAGQEDVQGEGPNGLPLEARALGVTVGDLRLWSLYVPNGRALDDPHYAYKLAWLEALRTDAEQWLAENPELPLALMGDWNIAPFDGDMGDPSFVVGRSTHVSPDERSMFESFSPTVTDVVRPTVPEGYTFWDYKAGRFPKDEGMRIDFIMASEAFAGAVTGASIHRQERTGDAPSDHVPVVVDVDPGRLGESYEDEDDLDRPMWF
ncbi:exodeoxyribonuclease III [Leucobacter sp. OLJS4]|uniref:exodeoxyribonuclease III n=1 Tax=unclassified Leucobacter TaxID=2621730 RepID=UPI000C19FC06|nr:MULTISPECIES: exodeoxyribonuclease III [unclassified Leucobacter]PIJ31592.1 exodeoxyribonuclease III [Leucobacter sp. OLES1]PII85015.1 exodeoxyribonuclease III [Leucobacter sp. OLCALW19]PII89025.1 exodeoxyribonuclease III [Leucobacter sp. OLTLW20]PII93566.1 exodeoxyribonuclease III [Leucobacter sp. OLAS13]PII98036.1 exodeoxyribonuclease III [Leucobacter sp. OLDS2]